MGEVVEAGFHRIGQLLQPACAFAVGQGRPSRECTLCGGDRDFDILRVTASDLCECFRGRRIEYITPTAAGRFACFSIDPVSEAHPTSLTGAANLGDRKPWATPRH